MSQSMMSQSTAARLQQCRTRAHNETLKAETRWRLDGNPWQHEAACAKGMVNPELFFSPDAADEDAARRICASCPVIAWCASDAEVLDPFGVRAGETQQERRMRLAKASADAAALALQRGLPAAHLPGCGTAASPSGALR